MRLLIPVLLLLWILGAFVALAEEPCIYTDQRTRVSCTLDAFSTIKSKCIGFETEAKVCATQYNVAEQGRLEATEALRKCVAVIPPPRAMLKPRLSLALTLLGSAALSAAVMSNSDPLNRAAFAGTGLVSIATGMWLMETE